MATLQKIRTNAGLLVAIVIGLALFSFILGDLFQSGSSIFRRTQNEVASINGESVQFMDYQKQIEELGEIYKMNSGKNQVEENEWIQIREQVWQSLLREKLMGKQFKKMGLAVTPEELFDMLQGSSPHPIVQQIFTNPETGQFERSAVVNFLKNLESGVTEEQKNYWLYLEDQIVADRLDSKYNNLVNKGLYVTGQEARQSLEAGKRQVDIEFITLSDNIIPDSTVTVSRNELEDYYDRHKDDFKSEKTRTVEYITYTVTPSQGDYANSEKWIMDIRSDFAATTENIVFVNSNSDVSFNGVWYKESTLPDSLAAWIFRRNAAVGEVYGPYFENNAYKLAKLHASEMLPDSVQARHILLKVTTQEEVARANALADSLKKLIEGGADFAALAGLYSTDTGSALRGGDLGMFGRGQMVKSFEDSAFLSKVNEVKITPSQFGLHIIQTTKRGPLSRQVQVASLERIVTPSTQTNQSYYAMAGKFASENRTKAEFDATVEKEKLAKKVATLRETDNTLESFPYPRPLIRAAFDASKGDILKNNDGSPIFELGDNFVIAVLTGITEEGISPLESVRARVELGVQKEKKAQLLIDRMKKAAEGKNSLSEIGNALGSNVQTAENINFNSMFLPGAGMEPAVIGTAAVLKPDVISAPVKGNNGVFILRVSSERENGNSDESAEKTRLAQEFSYRVNNLSLDIHKKAVKIEDKRPKFY